MNPHDILPFPGEWRQSPTRATFDKSPMLQRCVRWALIYLLCESRERRCGWSIEGIHDDYREIPRDQVNFDEIRAGLHIAVELGILTEIDAPAQVNGCLLVPSVEAWKLRDDAIAEYRAAYTAAGLRSIFDDPMYPMAPSATPSDAGEP